jgi:hypothetical protein
MKITATVGLMVAGLLAGCSAVDTAAPPPAPQTATPTTSIRPCPALLALIDAPVTAVQDAVQDPAVTSESLKAALDRADADIGAIAQRPGWNEALSRCENVTGAGRDDALEALGIPLEIAVARHGISSGKPADEVIADLKARLNAATTIGSANAGA